VTVNGSPAPLFYASPTQINFQMPSGVPAGTADIVVTNEAMTSGRALGSSSQQPTSVRGGESGPVCDHEREGVCLECDLSVHTAATPIPAGGYVILYITGQGSVTPPVLDGTAAPLMPLSLVDAPVTVSIGGKDAQVTFQGLAPGYAGLTQLNVIVPAGLLPGDQAVFVAINGLPSNAAVITVK
jgi:adhesin/invasin